MKTVEILQQENENLITKICELKGKNETLKLKLYLSNTIQKALREEFDGLLEMHEHTKTENSMLTYANCDLVNQCNDLMEKGGDNENS